MKLDVGSGCRPQGDVNIDLFIEDIYDHRHGFGKIKVKKIPNFVLCDSQYLPFKNDIFDDVYSHHVIEHVNNPFLMLQEMIRVCCGTIEIYTPHRLFRRQRKSHRCHFSKTWFYQVFKKLGITNFSIIYNQFYGLPHNFCALVRLPYEIKVTIKKG